MAIHENITEEHIRKTARYIDNNGVPPSRLSKFYDIIVDNKPWQPKYIIFEENIYVNNEELTLDRYTTHDAMTHLKKYEL